MAAPAPGVAGRRGLGAMVGGACLVALVAACAHPQRERPRTRNTAADRLAGGSPNVADSSAWRDQPTARIEELFAGRFPGVQVYAAPGGGIQVRIRGASTIDGSTEPLYVVDGYPLPPGTGGLVGINPADVARIEVLKSAGELAQYGVRGANGVVRITTKRGPSGDR